jgi:hypothetical protein
VVDLIMAPEERNTLGNPTRDKGFQRLRNSSQFHFKQLLPFRQSSTKLIDIYTGGGYGDGGESGPVLINLLEIAVSIYQRWLASHTPAVLVDAISHVMKPVAAEMALAMNYVIDKKLDLGSTLNQWVINAMFGWGILKVGETSPENPRPRGYRSNGFNVFTKVIGMEDWVHDTSAKVWEDIELCGHMYELTIEECMDNDDFDKYAKDELWNSVRKGTLNSEWADSWMDRPENIAHGRTLEPEGLYDKVLLWEYWTPRDDLIITASVDNSTRPLLSKEREGPECGPYHHLGFNPVPGNIMPIAPASLWEDMIDLINRLALKIGDQADRQRTILAAQNRSAGDMSKVLNTADGETVLTENDPNSIKEFRLGGVDGALMATFGQFKDLFGYSAGNIDAMGGLGASSSTIGQDKMIRESASERLNDYQQRVVKATTRVVSDVGWYMWNSDEIDLPLTKQITSTIQRDFRWNRFSRDDDFYNYNFSIVPISLQAKSSSERLQTITSVVQQTIIPLMELLASQGIQFDAFKYLEHVARLSNVQEINELLRNAQGMTANQRSPIESTGKSPVTQRNYTRQSIPGSATPEGKQQQAMEQFQKIAQQQSQQQSMVSP